ncbi:MAG: mannose-1-phosphate guanylyltransferase/mannose-6-phosphate isomerase [Stagnimonas sp.]|nr:mannose-1-phosphate guanylyltransferase/mannose-6-phosphate isomerase [Stagnimonas sp.]
MDSTIPLLMKTSLSASPTVVPVIMAGGNGTRLWPLSRESYPKQFLSLLGERSLLQDTVLTAVAISNAVAPVIIGAEAHRFLISEQLREIGIDQATILLEPEGRNTAPAAAVAAQYVAREYGAEAAVFLMSADHSIGDPAGFVAAAQAGAQLAALGRIVIFGIAPTRPETGFGYIRIGAPLAGEVKAAEVDAFVEKPNLETAQDYINSGRYYWNGGLFMFRADRLLSELRRLEPELCEHAAAAVAQGERDGQFLRLDAVAFRNCRNESIDYAVMEKSDALAVVPLDVGWDDVGSWNFLAKLPASDDCDNRLQGDVLTEDSWGNLVHASQRLVALVGVEDHVVVETDDAILVAHKNRVQDVKGVVQRLRRERRPEALSRSRMYRPWGFYETVAQGERFQVKRICVKPGEKLSLQMHHHRAEHWIVVKGTARVKIGDQVFLLSENESTYIPLGRTHRLENPGKVQLELIEVQSGAYLGEDDIVRFDDLYGRVAADPLPVKEPRQLAA